MDDDWEEESQSASEERLRQLLLAARREDIRHYGNCPLPICDEEIEELENIQRNPKSSVYELLRTRAGGLAALTLAMTEMKALSRPYQWHPYLMVDLAEGVWDERTALGVKGLLVYSNVLFDDDRDDDELDRLCFANYVLIRIDFCYNCGEEGHPWLAEPAEEYVH